MKRIHKLKHTHRKTWQINGKKSKEKRRQEKEQKESRGVTYGQSDGGILGWRESSSESVKITQ